MCDCVVTVPQNFRYDGAPGLVGLDAWVAEGDAAGEPASGASWWFTTYGPLPYFTPGDRLYIVCEGRLRGYAPLVEVRYDSSRMRNGCAPIAFIRQGGAQAVTIHERIQGFRGWKARWWERADEIPFPDWKTADRIARGKTYAKGA